MLQQKLLLNLYRTFSNTHDLCALLKDVHLYLLFLLHSHCLKRGVVLHFSFVSCLQGREVVKFLIYWFRPWLSTAMGLGWAEARSWELLLGYVHGDQPLGSAPAAFWCPCKEKPRTGVGLGLEPQSSDVACSHLSGGLICCARHLSLGARFCLH